MCVDAGDTGPIRHLGQIWSYQYLGGFDPCEFEVISCLCSFDSFNTTNTTDFQTIWHR